METETTLETPIESTDYRAVAEIDNERMKVRGLLARVDALEVEMAGDGMRFERVGCKYCLGCPICESELEDEI